MNKHTASLLLKISIAASNPKFITVGSLIRLNSSKPGKMDVSSSNIQDKTNGTSVVDISSSSNGLISALRSKIKILRSSNFQVDGQDHSQVSLDSCSNVSIKGSKGDLQLNKASNIQVKGDSNQVAVDSASNLQIQGNGNKLDLKKISAHVLQPSSDKDMNVFEVKLSSNTGNFASNAGANSSPISSVKYYVDYVDSAKIDGSQYNLGIFKFQVDIATSPFYIDVRVDPCAVEGLNLTQNSDGRSVQMEGRGQTGVVQKLALKGPRVSQNGANEFRIDLNAQQGSL